MRRALYVTAAMNAAAAALFLPSAGALRAIAGFPAGNDPLYPAMLSMFVLLFGVGYLWSAVRGRADPLFITIAAAGKLSFVTLLVWFWASGVLSVRAPLTGAADLVFGVLFVKWLITDQPARADTSAPRPQA